MQSKVFVILTWSFALVVCAPSAESLKIFAYDLSKFKNASRFFDVQTQHSDIRYSNSMAANMGAPASTFTPPLMQSLGLWDGSGAVPAASSMFHHQRHV